MSILAVFKIFKTDHNYYQIVFGESVLNDAIGFVMYESVKKYYVTHSQIDDKNITINGTLIDSNSEIARYSFQAIGTFLYIIICSAMIGYIIGYINALMLKIFSLVIKDFQKLEMCFLLFFPWASYIICQIIGLSGIISILFNGIAQTIHTKPNLSKEVEKVY